MMWFALLLSASPLTIDMVDGKIEHAVRGSSYAGTITVRGEPNDEVSLIIPDLIGSDGRRVALSTAPRLVLMQSGVGYVQLHSTLPAPGSYTAQIYATSKSSAVTAPLTVTWAKRAENSIDVRGSTSVELSRWPTQTESAHYRLVVTERSGERAELKVHLVGWDRIETDGKASVPAALADGTASIDSLGSGSITLDVTGLRSHGRQKGSILLSTSDGFQKTVELDATMTVHFTVALILIFIGVAGSHLMRRYVTLGRPKMLAARMHAGLRRAHRELAEKYGAEHPNLTSAITAELDDLADGIERADKIDPVNARIELVRRRIAVLAGVLAIRGEAATLASNRTTASLLASIDEQLLQILDADAIAGIDKAEEKIRDLGVSAMARGQLVIDRDQLLDRALRVGDANLVQSIRSVDLTRADMTPVRRDLDQAASAVAVAVAKRLLSNLVAHPAVDVLGWEALVRKVKPRLEAIMTHPSTAALDAVLEIYLEGKIRLLRSAIAKTRAIEVPGLDLTKHRESLDGATAKLDEAEQKIETDLDAAIAGTDGALALFAAAYDGIQNQGAVGAIALSGVFSGLRVPTLTSSPLLPRPPTRTASGSLPERERDFDRWVSVATLLVASLTGLRILWVDGWGSNSDYLEALLWGFGLHQATTLPLDGFAAFKDRWLGGS